MILVVIGHGAGHSGARDLDPGAQHHSGDPQVMDESLRGLVLLPPMLYCTWQCSVRAIQLEHLKLDVYVRGISLAISACVTVYVY